MNATERSSTGLLVHGAARRLPAGPVVADHGTTFHHKPYGAQCPDVLYWVSGHRNDIGMQIRRLSFQDFHRIVEECVVAVLVEDHFSDSGRHTGDLRVVINVVTPRHLNREQRELYEQLADSMTDHNLSTEEGVFGKLRRAFGGH